MTHNLSSVLHPSIDPPALDRRAFHRERTLTLMKLCALYANMPRDPHHHFHKPVRCVNDGKEYRSIGEAAKEYGLLGVNIGKSALKNRTMKCGLRFEFIEVGVGT